MDSRTRQLAKIILDYHKLNQALEKSDCILVLCSHDSRVATRAAELFLEGWAPLLIFSGSVGALTHGLYDKPEAEHFAEIAIELGVPTDKVLIENKARNTGENIRFTKKLLEEQKRFPDSFLIMQKPFMERRALATFLKAWPEKKVLVTSPNIKFENYPTAEFPIERIINIIVGDLQRIKDYPGLGFQVAQKIPSNVWQAFEELVRLGYDEHLIRLG